MQQRDLGIILQKTQVYVVDLKTKQKKYPIGPKGAVQAETDGKVAVIVYPQERARCYDLRHKTLLGRVGKKSAAFLCAVNGLLVIGYHRGPSDHIDLKAAYPIAYKANIREKIHDLILVTAAQKHFNQFSISKQTAHFSSDASKA